MPRYWNIKQGRIKVSGDQVRYLDYYEYEGYLWKGKDLYIPLTKENIDIILSKNPPGKNDNYLPAFAEACLKQIDRERVNKGKLKALKRLTMETIIRRPPLINHKNPKPFRNQRIGLEWINKFDGHALLWEMGSGKTRTGIEGFVLKKLKGKVTKGLVVCPAGPMVEKWVDEIHKWSDYDAIALIGTRQQKIEKLGMEYDFYVINYESVKSLEEEFLKVINEDWLIIADETTKIKNPFSQRTKAMIKIGRLTEHKIILTGTPVTQHAYDLFSQWLFLDNGQTFGLNYENFISKYFWTRGFKKIAKSGALQEISNLVYLELYKK